MRLENVNSLQSVLVRFGRGFIGRLSQDWRKFCQHTKGLVSRKAVLPAPGLHTFRYQHDGATRRLHLRTATDYSGVLFVDATEVIHLSPSACVIAYLLLEGHPFEVIPHTIASAFSATTPKEVERDLARVVNIIDLSLNSTNGCRVSALANLLDQREPFGSKITAPFKADLAITYGCNNRCSHCYNEADRRSMRSLPLSDWERVIDRLVAVGVPHLIITGGEPTLHPDLLHIISYADAAGPIVGMNTNGRRLAHLPFAEALKSAGLNHVQITLESSQPDIHDAMVGANAWKQTVAGIENALQVGLHTITNTTLTQRTAERVEDTIRFLHRLGIRTFAMNGIIHSGGGRFHTEAIPEDSLAPLLVRVRDYAAELGMRFLWYTPTAYCRFSPLELEIGAKRCNAGEYSICIEPNGDVLPCQSFYVRAGNILTDRWETIWQSELFRSFRERVSQPRECGLPAQCWDCPDLSVCAGGCPLTRVSDSAQARGRCEPQCSTL